MRARSSRAASARSARVVDAERDRRIGVGVGDHVSAVGAQDLDHIGQVQLTLSIVGVEPLECRPQRCGVEGEDSGADLGSRQLRAVGVSHLDDPFEVTIGRSDDAPERLTDLVGADRARSRSPAPPPPGGRPQGRVATGDRSAGGRRSAPPPCHRNPPGLPEPMPQRRRFRAATGCTAASRELRQTLDQLGVIGRHDHDHALGAELCHSTQRPVHSVRPQASCSSLGREDFIRVPLPRQVLRMRAVRWSSVCLRCDRSWGAWIRTRDHGTKTRCLTTWPRPIATGRRTSIGPDRPPRAEFESTAISAADRPA